MVLSHAVYSTTVLEDPGLPKARTKPHAAFPGSPSSGVNQERSCASILPVMTDGEALSGSGDKTSMMFRGQLGLPQRADLNRASNSSVG